MKRSLVIALPPFAIYALVAFIKLDFAWPLESEGMRLLWVLLSAFIYAIIGILTCDGDFE